MAMSLGRWIRSDRFQRPGDLKRDAFHLVAPLTHDLRAPFPQPGNYRLHQHFWRRRPGGHTDLLTTLYPLSLYLGRSID